MQKAVNSAGEFMQKSMFMFDPAMGQPVGTSKFPAAAAQQFFSYLPQEMMNSGSQYPQNPLIAPYMAQHNIQNSYVQEEPTQLRKLFIGGLNHETTDDQLKDYYSKWGTVIDCIVIRDPTTKHSRGFGFVTYSTIKMAEAAMDARPHTINGKVVDPKRAIPREHMLPLTPNNPPHFLENEPAVGCKLTLSGIHWDFHTVDGFRQYFEKFGEVEQVEIVGHPRGYGFIVFEDKASVERCLQAGRHHAVNGKKVEVKECSSNDPISSTTQIPSSSSSTPAKRQFNPRNQRGVSPADHYHQQRPNQRQNYHNQVRGNAPKHQDNNKRGEGSRAFVPQNSSLIYFPHLGSGQ